VQNLPCFDNPIKLKLLLVISLDVCVHNIINGFLVHAIRVEICQCELLFYL
jgi:hypothetical protein